MFKFEKTMEVRILHNQGLSNMAIAMKLRVSRNTVRKYLQQNGDGSLIQYEMSLKEGIASVVK